MSLIVPNLLLFRTNKVDVQAAAGGQPGNAAPGEEEGEEEEAAAEAEAEDQYGEFHSPEMPSLS